MNCYNHPSEGRNRPLGGYIAPAEEPCCNVYRIRIVLLFGFNIKVNDFGLNSLHTMELHMLRIDSVFLVLWHARK